MVTRWKRGLAWSAAVLVPVLALAGLWAASNQLLFPSWKGATRDLAVCPPELAAAWGDECGNLRITRRLAFEELPVPSLNGGRHPAGTGTRPSPRRTSHALPRRSPTAICPPGVLCSPITNGEDHGSTDLSDLDPLTALLTDTPRRRSAR
jgi:hypothetical protein